MPNNKYVIQGQEALKELALGLKTVASIVGSTMGPSGSLVVKADQYQPVFTKDGASVLDSLNLDSPTDQIVVKLLRDAANRGVKASGDGTTSTTVLTSAMVQWGLAELESGRTRREVVQELANDVNGLIDNIYRTSTPVKTLEDHEAITYISTNGDAVMSAIAAKAAFLVGSMGKININMGISREDKLEHVPGIRYSRGVANSSFLPADGYIRGNFKVMLVCEEVTLDDVIRINKIINTSKIVLVAPSYMDVALQGLLKLGNVIPVRMEGAGNAQRENIKDLAEYLGAKVVTNIDNELLGNVLSKPIDVYVGGLECVFSGSAVNDTQLNRLKVQLDEATDAYDRDMLEVRIARLTGGVATISVSGDTEAEMQERMHRYDDATKAALSAAKDGSNIGGGYVYLKEHVTLTETCTIPPHWRLAPIMQIIDNAELDIKDVLTKYNVGDYLNLRTFEYEDGHNYPVVDATMSQVSALKTSSSLARMILSSRAITRTGLQTISSFN